MEKRAFLAVILSIMVIIIYQYFFVPKEPVNPPVQKEEKEQIGEKAKKDIDIDIDIDKNIDIEDKALSQLAPLDQEIQTLFDLQQKRVPQEIVVENERFKAIINTKGATITSWKLKNYYLTEKHETSPLKMSFWKMVGKSYQKYFFYLLEKGEKEKEKPLIDLFELSDPNESNKAKGLQIVHHKDLDVSDDYANGVFETKDKDLYLDNGHAKETLTFTYITVDGFKIEKSFTFYKEKYSFDLEIKMENITQNKKVMDYSLTLGPGLGNSFQSTAHRYEGPVTWLNGKKIKDKINKNSPAFIQHQGDVLWLAMTSNYFANVMIPKSKIPQNKESEVLIQREVNSLDNIAINKSTIIGLHYPKREVNPDEVQSDLYSFYFGPKDYDQLKSMNFKVDQVIDYGFFSFLARPLMWLLNMFYRFIPNYGLAIVLLTLLIKLIFWPLTDKSFKSMKEMQELQPKLNAMRQKYKEDPTKLNQELLNLYKQKGVNPMGGCLPLLLQIPVFFALYEGLMVAVEMRGAPFIFWIKDLSVMDPLLITPLLMGVTMYIQQKMTPVSGDPAQVKMMTMLPLIFTVFFLGFPSGLVIYWLLNNLLTIGQHYWILKKMGRH